MKTCVWENCGAPLPKRGRKYCSDCRPKAAKAASDSWKRENLAKNRAYWREYRARNRERVNAYARTRRADPEVRRRHQLGRMGLTPEQYDEMLAVQGGGCAVCRTTNPGGMGRWHIDHDHSCCPAGRACPRCIRGLLCQGCNTGLGLFKDSALLLWSAARYLEGK